MFQKKQIIYSETLGVCVVDNIVSLAASKREKPVPYYVLKSLRKLSSMRRISTLGRQLTMYWTRWL